MSIPAKYGTSDCVERFGALRSLKIRAAFLFNNFLLIITALYYLKPASRSLFIEFLGADWVPYVWIGTALIMGFVVLGYHRLVERYNRFHVVLWTLLAFTGLLVMFRVLLINPTAAVSVGLYIFVDIFGVVLVEQFWSLTNSIYSTDQGKRWYGLVGTGGLTGGLIGGGIALILIKWTPLQTPDLLLAAAATLLIIFGLTWYMGRLGIYCEVQKPVTPDDASEGWKALGRSRYLILIAAILLLAQLASPVVEFQYLKTVEVNYVELDARTAFLSSIFSLLGGIAIAVNLTLTPLIQRRLGVIAGLLVQPLTMILCSLGFMVHSTLLMGVATKISDRGLSYSINRASKELLYVPVNPVLIYQAKAWIDMFGYRMFKIFSSVMILLLTQWLPVKVGVAQLSWITVGICITWIGVIMVLRSDYQMVSERELQAGLMTPLASEQPG
ncbi:MAG: ATP translocase [Proteobacteria bacterium]|nr:ATP translocase [Pseudomonadota bacterium]NIS72411.1 ATP translocase [Pseudomonadota bacterium]